MSQFEKVPDREAADIAEVTAHFMTLQRRFADQEGLPLQRGTHAKGVGARATFEVFDLEAALDDPGLARRLARGPFARPGTYDATVRFANAESRVQSDMKPDVRACSFTATVPDPDGDEARVDFSMNNSPIFPINDMHDFAVLMRVLAAPSGWKALGVFARMSFRERWRFLKTAVRGAREKKANTRVPFQLQRYWSTVPFTLGPDDAIKYSLIPRRHNHAEPLAPGPDMLRNELLRHLVEDTPVASFDVAVQLLDADAMTHRGRGRDPSFWIENAAAEWDEDQAPFHVVGRLSLIPGSQLTAEELAGMYMDVHEHGMDEFRPIGGINRGRWKPEKESRVRRFADAEEGGAVPVAQPGAGETGRSGLAGIPVLGPALAAMGRWARRAGRVPLGRVVRGSAVVVLLVLGGVLLLSLATSWYVTSGRAMLPDEAPDAVVYAEQGWGPGLEATGRQTYYYTPQGAGLRGMRYDWFVNLELPLSRTRFANADLMRRYGFIVDPATPANPDGLPVGFTKHYDDALNENVLSMSCAACHTGELHVTRDDQVTAYRIDGGQANHAFTDASFGNFVPTMLTSMMATLANPVKFNRFARRVLGDTYPEGKGALRSQMLDVIGTFGRIAVNERTKYPTEEGYGRTDALARISNTVFGENLDLDNLHVGNAPVSYPPLWNIWKFDWVQYNASVAQPMARNFGEALGVGATYALVDRYGRPLPPGDRFASSVMVENLNTIEHTLRRLDPPSWPEELFGPIDTARAADGRRLFNEHCVQCHGPFEADADLKARNAPGKGPDDPEWIVHVLCTDDVGTDPHAAQNFARARVDITRTGLTAEDLRAAAKENLGPWIVRTRVYL
ncbi:MAG: di-heme-cytochrome C peroxidase, partial [Longimicrobiales bacterium]|nr:di-heme-cytochrome C peroxidase [Longimicrobiales bacterium]